MKNILLQQETNWRFWVRERDGFTWLIIRWSHSSQRPTIDPALFKEIKRHWSRVTWKHLKRMREIPLRMSNGTFLAIDLCTHSQDDINSLSLTHVKKIKFDLHLFILRSFYACMTSFHLCNIKDDVLRNVANKQFQFPLTCIICPL